MTTTMNDTAHADTPTPTTTGSGAAVNARGEAVFLRAETYTLTVNRPGSGRGS
jgi:hypothetical protein